MKVAASTSKLPNVLDDVACKAFEDQARIAKLEESNRLMSEELLHWESFMDRLRMVAQATSEQSDLIRSSGMQHKQLHDRLEQAQADEYTANELADLRALIQQFGTEMDAIQSMVGMLSEHIQALATAAPSSKAFGFPRGAPPPVVHTGHHRGRSPRATSPKPCITSLTSDKVLQVSHSEKGILRFNPNWGEVPATPVSPMPAPAAGPATPGSPISVRWTAPAQDQFAQNPKHKAPARPVSKRQQQQQQLELPVPQRSPSPPSPPQPAFMFLPPQQVDSMRCSGSPKRPLSPATSPTGSPVTSFAGMGFNGGTGGSISTGSAPASPTAKFHMPASTGSSSPQAGGAGSPAVQPAATTFQDAAFPKGGYRNMAMSAGLSVELPSHAAATPVAGTAPTSPLQAPATPKSPVTPKQQARAQKDPDRIKAMRLAIKEIRQDPASPARRSLSPRRLCVMEV